MTMTKKKKTLFFKEVFYKCLLPFAFLPTLYSTEQNPYYCKGHSHEEPVWVTALLPWFGCHLPGTVDMSVAFQRAAADPKPHIEHVSFSYPRNIKTFRIFIFLATK